MAIQAQFTAGQVVALRAKPKKRGSVIEILPPAGGQPRYRVFHSNDDEWIYDEEQLIPARTKGSIDLGAALLQHSRRLDADNFRARLTAARLANPQVDLLYAFHAARIQFIPFQFKPVLRFLRSDAPRLLIADDVGVGKTIEAGLILQELRARKQINNVLVVCPKALTQKWKAEMERFDEDFQILNATTLRQCLDDTQKHQGLWPASFSRSIVPLQLINRREYVEGQDHLPHTGFNAIHNSRLFDLLIVDEAHHLRNPGSNAHKVVNELCDRSDAAVFLSATPIHTSSHNLQALLGLLRPDLFPNREVFQDVIAPNSCILAAMREVRQAKDGWRQRAVDYLRRAALIAPPVRGDDRYLHWVRRLQDDEPINNVDRIRCRRDLEELHSLSHVMNRTRRRDIDRFTIRDPRAVEVSFTPQQRELYDAIKTFRRKLLLSQRYEQSVVNLIITMVEQQAASCLHALVPTMDRFLSTGFLCAGELTDDVEEGEESIPERLRREAEELRHLAAVLPAEDPKKDKLVDIARQTMRADGPGKLLVFSYFLHTLSYLERALRSAGLRVAIISGRIGDEDRQELRRRFRLPRQEPDAIDVLLSSEVGCEGLDYEFCDRLVNYDIPWNPMRIEQRIGRLDRFGQKASKILIYNFITAGTIEERIFYRCFDRLGIFSETVGDHEEILGEVVDRLRDMALEAALTPHEVELQAKQTAENAIARIEEQRRLEAESSALLGVEDVYTEEIQDLRQRGKYVAPDDLRLMIERFLQIGELQGSFMPVGEGLFTLRLRRDHRSYLCDLLYEHCGHNHRTRRFVQMLQDVQRILPHFTFDQNIACDRRDVEFITPVHPLAKVAIAHWKAIEDDLVAHLTVTDATLPPGHYLFVCDLWQSESLKPEIRMVGRAVDLVTGELCDEVSANLIPLLSRSRTPLEPASIPPGNIERAFRTLDSVMHSYRRHELADLRHRNDVVLARQLAIVQSTYKHRVDRINQQIETVQNESIKRMRHGELRQVLQEGARREQELREQADADIRTKRIAGGILEINAE